MTAVILKSTVTSNAAVRRLLCGDYINLCFWDCRRAVLIISRCYSCSEVSSYSKSRKVIVAHSRREVELGMVRAEKSKARL